MCISVLALNSRSCQYPCNLEMYRSFPFKLEICVVCVFPLGNLNVWELLSMENREISKEISCV